MSYETQVKDARKRDVRITLETSDNGGFIVKCCYCGDGRMVEGPSNDKTYVYKTLPEALKDIPGMISIKQDMDSSDPIDKKLMKEDE
jgi:hypothetical protein